MTPEEIHTASEKMKTDYKARIPDDGVDEQATVEMSQPMDIYQAQQDIAMLMGRRNYPRGSSSKVLYYTEQYINGSNGTQGLANAHKRVEDDIELLKGKGEALRASVLAQQYMTEKFLPVVEAVANLTSPDELLNCKKALEALDKYALGMVRDMRGYTAAYLQTAYQGVRGNQSVQSDGTVTDAVRRINLALDNDQVRAGVGTAVKIKEQIDNGDAIASESDYELISRVAAS